MVANPVQSARFTIDQLQPRITRADIEAIHQLTQAVLPLATVLSTLMSMTVGSHRHSSQSMLIPLLGLMATNVKSSPLGGDGAYLAGDDPFRGQGTIAERLNARNEAVAHAKTARARERASAKSEIKTAAAMLGGKVSFDTSKTNTVSDAKQAEARLKELEAIMVEEQISSLTGTEETKAIRETSKKQRDAQLETDVIKTMQAKGNFNMTEAQRVTGLLKQQYSKLDNLQDQFNATTNNKEEQKVIADKTDKLKAHIKTTLSNNGLDSLDVQSYSLREAVVKGEKGAKFAWGKTAAVVAGIGSLIAGIPLFL